MDGRTTALLCGTRPSPPAPAPYRVRDRRSGARRMAALHAWRPRSHNRRCRRAPGDSRIDAEACRLDAQPGWQSARFGTEITADSIANDLIQAPAPSGRAVGVKLQNTTLVIDQDLRRTKNAV